MARSANGSAPGTGAGLYSVTEQDEVPADAVTASPGCGNPLAVADLRYGETVLDLGSGGGTIGYIASALSFAEYHLGLTEAGFTAISIRSTHEVATGLHSAIIRAVKA